MIKIGIIIPDRGDRPEFMKNCYRMLLNQTVWPQMKAIRVINFLPENESVDITRRYREGYFLISNYDRFNVDVIALMENDDWYAADYLEVMVNQWEAHGRPDIFGTNYTIYYHLKMRKYFTMRHEQRSAAMNTLIKPGMDFQWGLDHDPYTDAWLWNLDISKKVFTPPKIISVGMKHGVGRCGGNNHTNKLHRYINDDNGFLQNTLDEESFTFYNQMSAHLNETE